MMKKWDHMSLSSWLKRCRTGGIFRAGVCSAELLGSFIFCFMSLLSKLGILPSPKLLIPGRVQSQAGWGIEQDMETVLGRSLELAEHYSPFKPRPFWDSVNNSVAEFSSTRGWCCFFFLCLIWPLSCVPHWSSLLWSCVTPTPVSLYHSFCELLLLQNSSKRSGNNKHVRKKNPTRNTRVELSPHLPGKSSGKNFLTSAGTVVESPEHEIGTQKYFLHATATLSGAEEPSLLFSLLFSRGAAALIIFVVLLWTPFNRSRHFAGVMMELFVKLAESSSAQVSNVATHT